MTVKEEDKVTNEDPPPTAEATTENQNDEIVSKDVSTELESNASTAESNTPTANLKDITKDIMKIMTLNAIISTSKEEMIQQSMKLKVLERKRNIFALELLYQI